MVMKTALWLLLLVLLAFLATATGAKAQMAACELSGMAVRWNGEPIAGATIAVLAGPLETDQEYARTTTAADGSWRLQVAAGVTYWVHIRTFGAWWGYSYQAPFTPRPAEQISSIYLALGPRAVNDIVLPQPRSNLEPEVVAPAPGNNVGPDLGAEDEGPPPGMPTTGERSGSGNLPALLLLIGASLIAAGLAGRRFARQG
jgi:hypothetical protein